MKLEIRFSGFGGQGVILSSVILGKAAILEGKNVVQTQAYGPEKRGSLLRSDIIITENEEINYATIEKADVLVAMSEKALEKHQHDVKTNGMIIFDTQMIRNKELLDENFNLKGIPALHIADMIKNKLAFNIIL
ncbi:MAG: 2-oxoacid:acceptor oxidoreductase family protein, partial [Candidatus Helarchaeota archaeon]